MSEGVKKRSAKANRNRSSSVTDALRQVPLNSQGEESKPSTPPNEEVKPLAAGPPRPKSSGLPKEYQTLGFWTDLKTGRWLLVPASSFKLLVTQLVLLVVGEVVVKSLNAELKTHYVNPMRYLLIPGNRQPNGYYRKCWADLFFVFDQIILWSFVRQFVTIHILLPMGRALGIKGGKIMRFMEQGYAVFYFGIMGTIGVLVMKNLPTFWYKTEHFWQDYPYRDMTFGLKTYYLLQAAYWCQQLLILVARVEKPRKDFRELVAHHIVTLWLIGWSYNVFLTYIGNAVYVSMDVSDIFLALAKCVNYVNEDLSAPFFAFFVAVWTYFRHYLNIKMLWSVYTEFDLVPVAERTNFDPWNDHWLDGWMKWQIFVPILLLQFINLFWYFLILRILYRAVFKAGLRDSRSDDEDSEPEDAPAKKSAKGRKK